MSDYLGEEPVTSDYLYHVFATPERLTSEDYYANWIAVIEYDAPKPGHQVIQKALDDELITEQGTYLIVGRYVPRDYISLSVFEIGERPSLYVKD